MTMTEHKDLKRRVRARMRKTGEAYTTARAQLMKKPKPRAGTDASTRTSTATPARIALSSPSPSEYAAIAGMSDEKLKEKTGCTWERWVRALDHYHADEMSHAEIAKLIRTKYKKTPSWWTQMVAVGYERIRGLRARGQQRDGSYHATKSRTFDVPIKRLFGAWLDDASRHSWLTGTTATVRTATAPKSMRLALDDGSIVAVGFTTKGRGRSVVAVEHTKLADPAAAERVKVEWATRLDKLAEVLTVLDG
jgi:hypothetical protein